MPIIDLLTWGDRPQNAWSHHGSRVATACGLRQWGFYWYALEAGGRVLRPNDVPAPGDYLVRGEMEGYPETLKRLPPAIEVETFSVAGPGGRTMSSRDNAGGAGLYSNWHGAFIWRWGTGEWNHYELWQFQ